jgi:pimeloyl-ACP methyl ester carboxylesterase
MKHDLNGASIHIATGGLDFAEQHSAHNGKVLAFLHGSGQCHLTWIQQSRFFAHRGFAVLAPDFPGHGLSGGTPLTSITAQTDWLIALLDSLEVEEAILAGHSQGVLVALDAAARYPGRVQRLALIAGALAIPVNDMLVEMSKSAPNKAFGMMTSWGHGPPAHKFDNNMPGHSHLGYGRRVMALNDDAALHADLVACNAYVDGGDAAASVTQPALCLIAAHDKMTPAKFGKQMAASIKGAELQIFERAGHFLPSELPLEVNSAILTFLTR